MTLLEPAYATALDWLLCAALGQVADPGKGDASGPWRTGPTTWPTTRPLDQEPFEAARERIGDATLRRQVLAGAYRLVDAGRDNGSPVVQIAASGAVLPELAAAQELEEEGVGAHVVDVTSLDRLYSARQRTLRQGIRTATTPSILGALRRLRHDRPLVTVHDASSHTMAWLGSASAYRRSAWESTRSGSRGRSRTCTSCTTSRPAPSSTPRSQHLPFAAEGLAEHGPREHPPGLPWADEAACPGSTTSSGWSSAAPRPSSCCSPRLHA